MGESITYVGDGRFETDSGQIRVHPDYEMVLVYEGTFRALDADEVRAAMEAAVRRRNGQTRSDQLATQAAAAGLPAPAPGTPTAGSSREDGVAAAAARRARQGRR